MRNSLFCSKYLSTEPLNLWQDYIYIEVCVEFNVLKCSIGQGLYVSYPFPLLSLSLSLLASSASSAYLLDNDVELIGGHTKWDGIVRILYQKTWRLLCDNGTWTLNDARVSNGDAVLHNITCTCTFYVDRIQSFFLFLSFSLLFPPLCFRSSVTSLVIQ